MTTAATVLGDYNALTAVVKWYELIGLLDGVDDGAETFDLSNPQPRLEAHLAKLALDPQGFKDFKSTQLIPLRSFVTRHWFDDTRSEAESERLWYERRFSFLKLAVLLTRFERFNWKRFDGNADKAPSQDDVPQALAYFLRDAMKYGVNGWDALRTKMRQHHLSVCSDAQPMIALHYTVQ